MQRKGKDRSAVRGFSTDQRISIKSLSINQKRLEHQNNQSYLVGMSITESAMAREIENGEKRATIRCPVYDSENVHWKRVDELILKHSELVKSIKKNRNDVQ